jgi:O-antigen/teichoic acid export membrane protein
MARELSAAVAKGAVWVGFARLAVNALGFVGLIALARLLTPDDFGVVAIATALFAIITAATNLSVANALVQHRAPTDAHFDTAFTLNLMRGVLVLVLLCSAAVPISWIFNEPRLVVLMPMFGASALITGLQNPKIIVFLRQLDFRQQFLLQVGEKIATVLVSIVVALVARSYWALIAGLIAGQFVTLLISYGLIHYRPRFSLSYFREIFDFSLWLTLGQVLNMINWRLDQLLIGRFIGREALGHYAVGDNLASMPTREVTAPLIATLFPTFSRIADDSSRLSAAYARAQALTVAITLPAGVGLALLADPLVRLLLGDAWLASIIVIQGLAAIFAFQTIGSLAEPLAMARAKTRLLFFRDLAGFSIRVPLIIVGLLLGGFAGVVYARVLSGLIGIGFNMDIARRLTGLDFRAQLSAPSRSIGSVGVMAFVLFGLDFLMPPVLEPWPLALGIAGRIMIGALTYIGMHALLWRLVGCPSGVETDIIHFARKALRKMGNRREGITPAE